MFPEIGASGNWDHPRPVLWRLEREAAAQGDTVRIEKGEISWALLPPATSISHHCLPLAKSSQNPADNKAWEMQPSGVSLYDPEQDRETEGQGSLGHTQAVCPGQLPRAT